MVGACRVAEHAGPAGMLGIHDDHYLSGLERLTFAVKNEGPKIFAQIYHAGRNVHSSMIEGRKPVSASSVRSAFTGETPRTLESDEIPSLQDQ